MKVFSRAMPFAVAALLSSTAGAQDVRLFTWSGRVDRAVELREQGSNVTFNREQSIQNHGRVRVSADLPRRDGSLRVVVDRGRGTATVTQQPTAENGYTAVIRVADDEGGDDSYQVSAYWTGTDRGRGRGKYAREGDPRRSGMGTHSNAPMLHWTGEVDSEVQLVWRNGAVTQRIVSGGGVRNATTSVSGSAIAGSAGSVTATMRSGRGTVEVVQQPTQQNRWTTIIRVYDPQPGYGRYVVDAYWQ